MFVNSRLKRYVFFLITFLFFIFVCMQFIVYYWLRFGNKQTNSIIILDNNDLLDLFEIKLKIINPLNLYHLFIFLN